MNILSLCLSSGLGGLELYVYRSAIALTENNPEINACAVLNPESKLDHYFRQNSTVPIVHISRRAGPLPLRRARALATIIDEREIDVIHMHWGKDLPLAAFAKVFSNRKPALVYTRQMMITRYKKDIYHNFLYRQLDCMLTITHELETLCKKFIPQAKEKIQTLYYGVKAPEKILTSREIHHLRNEKGFSPDDFIIGLFGRLETGKGQHLLIRAVATAKQNKKNISAFIVGHEMNEGYRDELKALADELDVSDKVIFCDFVDNPQLLMQICDVISLTSFEETFGLVLPEAMRAGIAVIGSNNGGVPEIIEHNKSGRLFETGNDDSLYEQIAGLYDNPDLKHHLAKQGKDKADKLFNHDIHFRHLEEILRECTHHAS